MRLRRIMSGSEWARNAGPHIWLRGQGGRWGASGGPFSLPITGSGRIYQSDSGGLHANQSRRSDRPRLRADRQAKQMTAPGLQHYLISIFPLRSHCYLVREDFDLPGDLLGGDSESLGWEAIQKLIDEAEKGLLVSGEASIWISHLLDGSWGLGSGLIDHSQKRTAAARRIAEK
jgi:hypothetical protein